MISAIPRHESSSDKRSDKMFHDRALKIEGVVALPALAFELNAQALRLAAMVEYYRQARYDTLPVQYLRRAFFTRREWELATKGTRMRDGNKLVNPEQLGKDGCEHFGIVTEKKLYDAQSKTSKTVWFIGEPCSEKLEAVKDEIFEKARNRLTTVDVSDSFLEEFAADLEFKEDVEARNRTKPDEEIDGDARYAEGRAHEHAEWVKAGHVFDEPPVRHMSQSDTLLIRNKGAAEEHVCVPASHITSVLEENRRLKVHKRLLGEEIDGLRLLVWELEADYVEF